MRSKNHGLFAFANKRMTKKGENFERNPESKVRDLNPAYYYESETLFCIDGIFAQPYFAA